MNKLEFFYVNACRIHFFFVSLHSRSARGISYGEIRTCMPIVMFANSIINKILHHYYVDRG